MRKCRSISHKTTYGMHLFWLVQRFVASNVAKYKAFSNAVSLGNTLLWRFSLR